MPTYQSYPPSLWLPASSVATLTPATGAVGASFTLTVDGSGFRPDSRISFDGDSRPTTYISATRLTCAVAGLVGPARTVQVTVSTGGSAPFNITAVGDEPEPESEPPTEPQEPAEPEDEPVEPSEPTEPPTGAQEPA